MIWHGRCEPGSLTQGVYEVPIGEGGDYVLVFDNTYSRTVAKTVSFSLMTYSTSMPPPMTHTVQGHRHASNASMHKPQSMPAVRPDVPQLSINPGAGKALNHIGTPVQSSNTTKRLVIEVDASLNLHTGYLKKRRRKKGQGWGRRYFSLDKATSTLSYYHDRRSVGLRGVLPLSFATITLSGQDREISLDSGAEVWHLRAHNAQDFERWKAALEAASNPNNDVPIGHVSDYGMSPTRPFQSPNDLDRQWAQAETVLGRVASTRDAVRRLALSFSNPQSSASPMRRLPSREAGSMSAGAAQELKRKPSPFWKRTFSTDRSSKLANRQTDRSKEPNVGVTPSRESLHIPNAEDQPRGRLVRPVMEERSMADHMQALLRDLDSVVSDFSRLLTDAKQLRRAQRRLSSVSPRPNREESRRSFESTSEQEFFDAEEDDLGRPRILNIQHDSEDMFRPRPDSSSDHSSHGSDEDEMSQIDSGTRAGTLMLFPPKPEGALPLSDAHVRRRTHAPVAKVMPPSLIGFLRKNVGKDLSSVSMPISANEPTSLLQRVAEQLEYSNLLDLADAANDADGSRLAYVAAFAGSMLSNARMKERAIRKPFNPLLGETFEYICPEQGFRFLAEKVSHRPVQVACCAESTRWTLIQCPKPTQKFWGKSVELNTDGKIRVRLHGSGEVYSWPLPTCFLRNIIAGEKYLDPVGAITVHNETSGARATVAFKAKGMFSGRSEEVEIQLFDPHGAAHPQSISGRWTDALTLQPSGTTIWRTGALVPDAARCYGMTTFAAGLNEITPLERGNLPSTDCRLRPDQRMVEEGDLEAAERVKGGLEEGQRMRRRREAGAEWVPRWFERVAAGEGAAAGKGKGEEDEEWRLKGGEGGYWAVRAKGGWEGVGELFEAEL